jgi:AAA+ superfamily predicted ATPase
MASNKQLTALFRAIAAENFSGAADIAAQICQQEEEKGHLSAARMLRGALNASRNGGASPKAHPPIPNGSSVISSALTRLPSEVSLDRVSLSNDAKTAVTGLILEWNYRQRLLDRGIARRSKLFFYGPPGCGKSLTARALATELGLPLFLVRFDAVIGAYLGQTAIHLRQLFHFAETTSCILLFDELDALGKQRGNPTDVGELDRIVIAMMQELEHANPQGIIIGTSNLAKDLDEALWRRFDFALEFEAPNQKALTSLARRVATEMKIELPAEVLGKAAKAKNFANVETIVISEARDQALRGL